MAIATKDRQRWQPEEDAVLNAYVTQFGPDDWNLISERMGESLDRDPKSCHERWKNYLKPGIKKGPLSEEEQQLVIKLQTKYGNKWKRIAAEVPGRTAKRLGKWWEVYKERKLKEKRKSLITSTNGGTQLPALAPSFSRPFISNLTDLCHSFSTSENGICKLSGSDFSTSANEICKLSGAAFSTSTASENGICKLSDLSQQEAIAGDEDETLLTLGLSSAKSQALESVATSGGLPQLKLLSGNTTETAAAADGGFFCLDPTTESSGNDGAICFQGRVRSSLLDLFKDLKDNRENWILQKKKIGVKLKEVKKQLELEKLEKKRQKMEKVEAAVKALKADEKVYMERLDEDYAELICGIEQDAEMKEKKLMDAWTIKYEKLVHVFDQQHSSLHGPLFQAIHSRRIDDTD